MRKHVKNPNVYEFVSYANLVRTMNVKRALISVSDKGDLTDFAKGLYKLGIEIFSTGGTASALQKAGIKIKGVSDVTSFPEMLDGRVKTLHPIIHAGILAKRDNKRHMDVLKKHKIGTIDLLVCNLYPFEKTIQKQNVGMDEVIENIDIGGPTLIRSAAKNYRDVIVVTNKKQYDDVLKSLESKGKLSLKEKEKLALDAFSHTAQYDSIISNYLRDKWTDEVLPDVNSISMRKIQDMRYGENPHQKGAFYESLPKVTEPCISNAKKLQGKELSFNNILDGDCAIECVKEFEKPTCVIIKHATPCGIASASNLLDAWKDAYATDTYSPFGGIISFNREVGKNVAEELSKLFLEVIIAPNFTNEACDIFGKKKNLRLSELKGLDKKIHREGMVFRSVIGGFLSQERDVTLSDRKDWETATTWNLL